MKSIKKISLTLLLFLSSLSVFVSVPKKVSALFFDQSYYDAISWIYIYQDTYTKSYNCLGWATGSMVFEWPSSWGTGATQLQVNAYLALQGYKNTTLNFGAQSTKIVAYGPSANSIVHFSKVTPTEVTAKSHALSMDPYYANSDYGSPRVYYYK
mgnify:FL=1